jgi:hypothetical protein
VREDKGWWRGPDALKELVDETGTPVLYITGSRHHARRARTGIAFPDGRWLRFLVRGTEVANAIMTAVDQAGNRIVRYRDIGGSRNRKAEIIVNPGWGLADELVLAIAISASWLESYFVTSYS